MHTDSPVMDCLFKNNGFCFFQSVCLSTTPPTLPYLCMSLYLQYLKDSHPGIRDSCYKPACVVDFSVFFADACPTKRSAHFIFPGMALSLQGFNYAYIILSEYTSTYISVASLLSGVGFGLFSSPYTLQLWDRQQQYHGIASATWAHATTVR
jgi:hypothetical protein